MPNQNRKMSTPAPRLPPGRWVALLFFALAFLANTAVAVEGTGAAAAHSSAPPAPARSAPVLANPRLMRPDVRRILERGSLMVAVFERDCQPFAMRGAEGFLKGVNIQLLKGFAKDLGVDLAYDTSAKTYDGLVDLVARGAVDTAACGVSRTLNRAKYVSFTRPYLILRQGLLINRVALSRQADGRLWGEVIQGLQGRLGALADSSYEGFARKHFGSMEIVPYPSVEAAQQAAARGEITAVHLDELDIKMLIRNRPNRALQFQTVLFKDVLDHLAMPVAWHAPGLLALLDIYLEEHKIGLSTDQLLDSYLPLRPGAAAPGSE